MAESHPPDPCPSRIDSIYDRMDLCGRSTCGPGSHRGTWHCVGCGTLSSQAENKEKVKIEVQKSSPNDRSRFGSGGGSTHVEENETAAQGNENGGRHDSGENVNVSQSIVVAVRPHLEELNENVDGLGFGGVRRQLLYRYFTELFGANPAK